MSFYKVRGSDQIYIRKKGGPSRAKVKEGSTFINTRRNNDEFGGRAAASSWIMLMLQPLKPLGDYNIAGPLNSLLVPINLKVLKYPTKFYHHT